MKIILKKIPKTVIYIVPCILLTGILIAVICLRANVTSKGNSLGEMAGLGAGKVSGSLEALKDYRRAVDEGKETGLNAEDTTAEVDNKIKELNKLEVFVASVKLNDVHSVGKEDYVALYLLKGDAVFTIDFSKVEIEEEGNVLHITIPEPEIELIIDQNKIEKVAEYQKIIGNGSAEDGFDGYLASMKKITSVSKETLANYDVLMENAKESARKQVEQLVHSVSVSKFEVEIMFAEKED